MQESRNFTGRGPRTNGGFLIPPKPLVRRCLSLSLPLLSLSSPYFPSALALSSYPSTVLFPVSSWVHQRSRIREKERGRGRQPGDGTDLKQHGRQSDPKAWGGEKECRGWKGSNGENGARGRGKLMATCARHFCGPTSGSFHLPRVGRDRLRGRDCRA